MPPKQNPKAVAAAERKAEAAAVKNAEKDRQRQQKEDEEWSVGAKGNDKQKKEEEKRQRQLEAKKAREEAEKNDMKELSKMRSVKQANLVDTKPERGSEKKAASKEKAINEFKKPEDVEEYQARNIEDALDLLDLTTASSSSGGSASKSSEAVDKHPERRMKAAYLAYEEKMMPILKEENPTLRLSQLRERIFKLWGKAPENPMNQQTALAYDATRDEKLEFARQQQEMRLESMRMDSKNLAKRSDSPVLSLD